MSKILTIIKSMVNIKSITYRERLIDSIIDTECPECGKSCSVTVDAIYRQHLRGREIYLCRSCASKRGWTKQKRLDTGNRSTELWKDPDYAGTIDGKALANEIRRLTDDI